MQAGKLRHRVVIEVPREATDSKGFGDSKPVWDLFVVAWASIEPRAGSERFEDETVAAQVTHFVTMRWRDGVTPAMRVKEGERTFEIDVVRNIDERDRQMVLFCREVV